MNKIAQVAGGGLATLVAGAVIMSVSANWPAAVPVPVTPPAPPVLSCTSDYITRGLKHMLDNRVTLPFGAGNLKVFKQFEYRPNPAFGKSAAFMVDTKSPCKVNIMTSRGELGFTYGWKVIDGEVYMTGQIDEPDDKP